MAGAPKYTGVWKISHVRRNAITDTDCSRPKKETGTGWCTSTKGWREKPLPTSRHSCSQRAPLLRSPGCWCRVSLLLETSTCSTLYGIQNTTACRREIHPTACATQRQQDLATCQPKQGEKNPKKSSTPLPPSRMVTRRYFRSSTYNASLTLCSSRPRGRCWGLRTPGRGGACHGPPGPPAPLSAS